MFTLTSWTKISLNNHQPSKALKLSRQPSKLDKNNRQSYHLIETLRS